MDYVAFHGLISIVQTIILVALWVVAPPNPAVVALAVISVLTTLYILKVYLLGGSLLHRLHILIYLTICGYLLYLGSTGIVAPSPPSHRTPKPLDGVHHTLSYYLDDDDGDAIYIYSVLVVVFVILLLAGNAIC